MNARATIPGTHSYSILIRDTMLSRLRAIPYFAAFKGVGRARGIQIQPQDVPYIGCYFLNEVLGPDGDPNHAEPRFIHTLNMGFSVIIQNNDIEQAEDNLDQAYWIIMNTILTDPSIYDNDQAQIEGYNRVARTHHYGTAGSDNSLPVAELRMEFACTYRTFWTPVVPDWLQLVYLETAFPDVASRGEVMQVKRYWYFYNLAGNNLVVGAPVLGTPTLS